MKKENGYFVEVKRYDSDDEVKTLGPYSSARHADKVERGIYINLNHDEYYVEFNWYGPDSEPTDLGL